MLAMKHKQAVIHNVRIRYTALTTKDASVRQAFSDSLLDELVQRHLSTSLSLPVLRRHAEILVNIAGRATRIATLRHRVYAANCDTPAVGKQFHPDTLEAMVKGFEYWTSAQFETTCQTLASTLDQVIPRQSAEQRDELQRGQQAEAQELAAQLAEVEQQAMQTIIGQTLPQTQRHDEIVQLVLQKQSLNAKLVEKALPAFAKETILAGVRFVEQESLKETIDRVIQEDDQQQQARRKAAKRAADTKRRKAAKQKQAAAKAAQDEQARAKREAAEKLRNLQAQRQQHVQQRQLLGNQELPPHEKHAVEQQYDRKIRELDHDIAQLYEQHGGPDLLT